MHGKFFYLSECAVLTSNQNKGIGRKMLEKLFNIQKLGWIILRTKNNSSMQYLIEKMGGKVSHQEPSDQIMMIIKKKKKAKKLL